MSVKDKSTDSSESKGLRLALLVIATAQLMFVLDDAIANIALPSIQRELAVPAFALPWIINAYILAFGGLLLFGGRVGDLYGRRKVFSTGLIVFITASLLGGLAPNVELLIGARGLQGIGAALAAPNALAMIATTFPVGKPRNAAMAVYGAMSALGITLGVLLGGLLTDVLSWRWVFFINVPIGLAVVAGVKTLVEGERSAGKLDLPGALSGVGAMVTLTYGVTRGGEHAWSDAVTMGSFALAAILMLLFVWLQRQRQHPILPLALFSDRNRSGAYATMLFVGAGLMGTFYLLTLFLQQVMLFSPLKTGLSSLPFSFGIILGAGISSKLVERLAPRFVTAPGLLVAGIGMFWLSTLTGASSYTGHVLPAVFMTSFGLGVAAITMTLTAVHRVAEDQAGVASSLVNTGQQIGAALGLALFTTVAISASNDRMPDAARVLEEGIANNDTSVVATASAALTEGYTSAFFAGAIMLIIAALLVVVSITTKHTQAADKAPKLGA